MLTWLATTAAGRFGHIWLGGAILASTALATTAGVLSWQLWLCQGDKAALQTSNGELAGEVRACSGQTRELQRFIDDQNEAIANMLAENMERERRAGLAVDRELDQPPASPPQTATAAEYNRWMREMVCSVGRCPE